MHKDVHFRVLYNNFFKGKCNNKTIQKNTCNDRKHRLANVVFINRVCRKKRQYKVVYLV